MKLLTLHVQVDRGRGPEWLEADRAELCRLFQLYPFLPQVMHGTLEKINWRALTGTA